MMESTATGSANIHDVARNLAFEKHEKLENIHPQLFAVLFSDAYIFDMYTLEVIQSFIFERWVRIVHWDESIRKNVLDLGSREETAKFCETCSTVRISDARKNKCYADSTEKNEYAIENLRNGLAITYGRALSSAEAKTYWSGQMVDEGRIHHTQMTEYEDPHQPKYCQIPETIYWGRCNGRAVHIGNSCDERNGYWDDRHKQLEIYVKVGLSSVWNKV